MATFRKRGNTWRAEVTKHGVRRSATFDTKAEAMSWATKLEAEILDGKVRAVKHSRTLATAMEKYRDEISPGKGGFRMEQIRLNKFINTLDFIGVLVDRITSDKIAEWRDNRLKEVATSTVNREMNLLSAVFEECRRDSPGPLWALCSFQPNM